MDRLYLFARAPEPGRVKTRLAAGVGEARALALYRAFLADTLAVCARVRAELVLSVAGDPDHPDLVALAPDVPRRPQGRGNLGTRMARAFDEARDLRRVAIVGSDHPTVRAADIEACLAAADPGTLVLAPVDDGGFWCLAGPANLELMAVLAEVPWSTAQAREVTAARAQAAGLLVHEGPSGFDVDDAADLVRLEEALRTLPPDRAPATRAVLGR